MPDGRNGSSAMSVRMRPAGHSAGFPQCREDSDSLWGLMECLKYTVLRFRALVKSLYWVASR